MKWSTLCALRDIIHKHGVVLLQQPTLEDAKRELDAIYNTFIDNSRMRDIQHFHVSYPHLVVEDDTKRGLGGIIG